MANLQHRCKEKKKYRRKVGPFSDRTNLYTNTAKENRTSR